MLAARRVRGPGGGANLAPELETGHTRPVQSPERANRIEAVPCGALAGGSYELRSRAFPWDGRQRWPRSRAEDAERALAAAGRAADAWGRLPRGERVERLLAGQAALEALDLASELAPALGLAPSELRPRLDAELFRFGEGLEMLREGPPERGGAPGSVPGPAAPGAFAAHWTDFAAGLGMRLAGRLVEGSTAVVWSDPALPAAAAVLVEALEAGGVPPGVLGLLHDDLGESLGWALGEGALGWARLKGPPARLKSFDKLPPRTSIWPLRNGTALVLEGEDPAARARDVALKAVGRSDTLSGQMPGQVGRVICHQRLFSRFSEELLHDLEATSASHPGVLVPAIDGDLPGYVRRAWALGLDEGATPILGDEPLVRPAEPPPAIGPLAEAAGGRAEAGPAGRPPGVVPPVIFTNVEPHQRIARLRRPAPVVVLLRASSDRAASELAVALEAAD